MIIIKLIINLMEVMIVKKNTIAKILLSVLVVPSLITSSASIYAAPGDGDGTSESTQSPTDETVNTVELPQRSGDISLRDMKEGEKNRVRNCLLDNLNDRGVLDLSSLPTSDMPLMLSWDFTNIVRDKRKDKGTPVVKSIKLSYKHLYDILTQEIMSRNFTVEQIGPKNKIKRLSIGNLLSEDRFKGDYKLPLRQGSAMLWFKHILKCARDYDIGISFDYIMPIIPDPYDPNCVIDISKIYEDTMAFEGTLAGNNSLLVYTNNSFSIEDWINDYKKGLSCALEVAFFNNINHDESWWNNQKPEKAYALDRSRKDPLFDHQLFHRSQLERVAICGKSTYTSEELETLKRHLIEDFNYAQKGEISVINQLDPSKIPYAPSTLASRLNKEPTKLEPCHLNNVFLHVQKLDTINGDVQKNFSMVSKHTKTAMQQTRIITGEQLRSLPISALDLIPNIETVVLTEKDFERLCPKERVYTPPLCSWPTKDLFDKLKKLKERKPFGLKICLNIRPQLSPFERLIDNKKLDEVLRKLSKKFEVRFNSLFINSQNDPFVKWALELGGTMPRPLGKTGALRILFDRSDRANLTALYEIVKANMVGSETYIPDKLYNPTFSPFFPLNTMDLITQRVRLIDDANAEPLKHNRYLGILQDAEKRDMEKKKAVKG